MSNERNEGPIVVVVHKSFKSPLFNGGGQFMDDNEKVGGNGVAIEKAIEEAREEPANGYIIVEGFGEDQRSLEISWKNNILPMWQFWKLVQVGVKQLGIICEKLLAMFHPHYVRLRNKEIK